MKHHTFGVGVVAIDPTSRGFAYAVLEGKKSLVDWGLIHVLLRSDKNVLSRVEEILDRTLPDLLVIEDGRCTRRRERARRLIKGIEGIAKRRKLRVVRISRRQIQDAFAPAVTKQQIAEALARMFTELVPRLPRLRKAWMCEDERMNIFDAVSLALAAMSK